VKEKLQELNSYIEEIKLLRLIKSRQKSSFLQSEVYNCYLNNGRVINREKLIKGGKDGSAVIIIPVTEKTVIEPRVFTKEGYGIGFPAGYIETLEDPEASARRELEEETGYISDKLIELDSFYQDEGCSSSLNHIFLALDCIKEKQQKLDKDEIIKYMLFTYDELLELERLGYIKGANTKLAISKIKNKIRRWYLCLMQKKKLRK